MKKFVSITIFGIFLIFQISASYKTKDSPNLKYFGNHYFLIEGTAIEAAKKESPYDRLPASYKDKVRKEVWDLSKSSAGLSVRFRTNSSTIGVKWTLLNDMHMNHMADTGIKGVDLYYNNNGSWQYVNTGRPTGKDNEALLVSNMDPEMREYKLYLPLYDGITNLEIGINGNSKIIKPGPSDSKPIVFYGTSITQGGCASRTGMAYSNIISRKVGKDCINFGFSGNGEMEAPIAEVMSGIDASFYVIDCLPNMNIDQVHENTIPLVQIIREEQPDAPIVFVENLLYEKSFLDHGLREDLNQKNEALHEEYEKMLRNGYKYIFYISRDEAIGNDHEGTVDGVHFTDLGFMRFADYLITKFRDFKIID